MYSVLHYLLPTAANLLEVLHIYVLWILFSASICEASWLGIGLQQVLDLSLCLCLNARLVLGISLGWCSCYNFRSDAVLMDESELQVKVKLIYERTF